MDGNGKIYGMRRGECAANNDPVGLGRVRVRIPGLIEPQSDWCWPIGWGGHRYDVPCTRADYAARSPSEDRPGDELAIWFEDGETEWPFYQPCHGGMLRGVTPEIPDAAQGIDPADASKVKAFQWADWTVTIDERTGSKSCTVQYRGALAVKITDSGIFLGSGSADEPFVLGNVLKSLLTTLATALDTHTHTFGGSGPPSPGTFTNFRTGISGIVSSFIKGQKTAP